MREEHQFKATPKTIAKANPKSNKSFLQRDHVSTMGPQTPKKPRAAETRTMDKLSSRHLMVQCAQETLLEMVRCGEDKGLIQKQNEIIREMLKFRSKSPDSEHSNTPYLPIDGRRSPSDDQGTGLATDNDSVFVYSEGQESQDCDTVSSSDPAEDEPAAKRQKVVAGGRKILKENSLDGKSAVEKGAVKKTAGKKPLGKMPTDKSKVTAAPKFTSLVRQKPGKKATSKTASNLQAQLPAAYKSSRKQKSVEISRANAHTASGLAQNYPAHRASGLTNKLGKVPRRPLERIIKSPTSSPASPSLPPECHPLSIENLTKYQTKIEEDSDREFEKAELERAEREKAELEKQKKA